MASNSWQYQHYYPERSSHHGSARDASPGERRRSEVYQNHGPPRSMIQARESERPPSSSSAYRSAHRDPYEREYHSRRSSYDSPPYHYGAPLRHSGLPPQSYSRSMYCVDPPPRRPEYEIDLRNSGGCTCKKSKCLKLYCQCFASSVTCGPRCKCQSCHNTTMHGSDIEEARRVILERNPSAFEDKFVKELPMQPPPLPHEHVARYAYYEEEEYYHRQVEPAVPAAIPTSAPPPLVSSPSRRQHKSGCKCRRSFCLKKYCECFHHGARCGDMCRCINCKNKPRVVVSPPRRFSQEPPKEVLVSSAPSLNRPRVPHEEVRMTDHHIQPPPEVRRHEEAGRAVPEEEPDAEKENQAQGQKKEESSPVEKEKSQDQMAIMAAVAMTQLFGQEPSEEKKCDDDQPRRIQPVEVEESQKRKPQEEVITNKRAKVASPTMCDDDEVRAVVSSSSSHVSASPSTDSGSHSYAEPSPAPRPPYHRYYGYYGYGGPPRAPRRPPPPPPPQLLPMDVCRKVTDLPGTLPKALSFRKICSKCGKTRGEHGELGFGNKCVYQDCGRCGAGIQMHVKAGVPMGFMCTLSVKDGATPGAAERYDRKIRDLAVQAELSRGLNNPAKQPMKEPIKA